MILMEAVGLCKAWEKAGLCSGGAVSSGLGMFSCISAAGAAVSDSPEEQLFFWVVMLFS